MASKINNGFLASLTFAVSGSSNTRNDDDDDDDDDELFLWYG